MDGFNFEISKVSEVLLKQSAMFNCSLEETWRRLMHPAITERFSFQEVKKYIDEQSILTNKL